MANKKQLFLFILLLTSGYLFSQNKLKVTHFNKIIQHKITIVVFIAPTCPICKRYSGILNQLYTTYKDSNNIEIFGIIPGKFFTHSEINNYLVSNEIKFPIYKDKSKKIVKLLNATITPECFLLFQGKEIYSGAIDNWYYDIGKSSNKITNNYLTDAIKSVLSHSTIKEKKTSAVGCIIE